MKNTLMKIVVKETRTYLVPANLAPQFRKAMAEKDQEWLDELLADLESHEGADQIVTNSVQVVK